MVEVVNLGDPAGGVTDRDPEAEAGTDTETEAELLAEPEAGLDTGTETGIEEGLEAAGAEVGAELDAGAAPLGPGTITLEVAAAPVSVSVTGQIVVRTGMVEVTTTVE